MRMSLNLDPAFLLSSRAYGLKGKNAIWVKSVVAGVWSKGEKRHFGSKELSRAYGLKGKTATLGQKCCRGRMV